MREDVNGIEDVKGVREDVEGVMKGWSGRVGVQGNVPYVSYHAHSRYSARGFYVP